MSDGKSESAIPEKVIPFEVLPFEKLPNVKLVWLKNGEKSPIDSDPSTVFVEKKIFQSENGPIGYYVVGQARKEDKIESEDLTTVVGFNGMFASLTPQIAMMRALDPAKFRGIFFEAPGHNGTYTPTGKNFTTWTKDVAQVLDNEKIDKNMIAFGSSMGGTQALYLAKLLGEKVVGVLVDNPKIDQLTLSETLRAAPRFIMDAIGDIWYSSQKENLNVTRAYELSFALAGRVMEMFPIMRFLGTIHYNDFVGIAAKAVVLFGKYDRVVHTKAKLDKFSNLFQNPEHAKYWEGKLNKPPENEPIFAQGNNPIIVQMNGPHSWGLRNLAGDMVDLVRQDFLARFEEKLRHKQDDDVGQTWGYYPSHIAVIKYLSETFELEKGVEALLSNDSPTIVNYFVPQNAPTEA